MGTQTPPEKGGGAPPPQFSARDYCGQAAEGIKMVLGVEVGLSPGDFVLDGNPAPPTQKGDRTPSQIFGPFPLWPNGWMHQHATWYGGRRQPSGLCARWGPSPLPQKGDGAPNFPPMFIVAKRLDESRWYLA